MAHALFQVYLWALKYKAEVTSVKGTNKIRVRYGNRFGEVSIFMILPEEIK
jgi:hypothetical protein